MSKRITSSRINKWATGLGITAIPLATLLFWYLASIGAITVIDFTGDTICAGTELDPCIAIIEFTANEDIFIYPSNNWTSTPFYTDPSPKSLKMYRSWGTGWREIKLNETCKGTWCGGKGYTAKYAYAFREGRSYKIKYEMLKTDPSENVKWGFEQIDPIFLGINEENIFPTLIENKAGLTGGYAIFEFYNPLDRSVDVSKELNIEFMHLYGSPVKSFKLYTNYTRNIATPTYTQKITPYPCNGTTCNSYENIQGPYEIIEVEDFKENAMVGKGYHKIKLVAEWDLAKKGIAVDWVPNMTFSKEDLGLENKITLRKNEWAWWNVSEPKKVVINFTTGDPLSKNYTHRVIIDKDSDMGASCEKMALIYNDSTEIDKHLRFCNDTALEIAWREQNELDAGIFDNNISIYFGVDITSKSDRNVVYLWNDDCEGASINTTKYTDSSGMDRVGDGICSTGVVSGGGRLSIKSDISFNGNATFEIGINLYGQGTDASQNYNGFMPAANIIDGSSNWGAIGGNQVNKLQVNDGGIVINSSHNFTDTGYQNYTIFRNGTTDWRAWENSNPLLGLDPNVTITRTVTANDGVGTQGADIAEYNISHWRAYEDTNNRPLYALEPVLGLLDVTPRLFSTTNLTTEILQGFCTGTSGDAELNVSYYWQFFKDGINFSEGSNDQDTNFTSGIEINVANISAVNLTDKNNWTLGCMATNWDVNSSRVNSSGLIINPPIFVNITYPENASIFDVTETQVNYTIENFTELDSCWWSNDSGQINNSLTCGTNISAQTWGEGNIAVRVYGNDSSGFEFFDVAIFIQDTLFPLINYTDEFIFSGWLNFNNVTVGVIVDDPSFANITFRLRNLTEVVNITFSNVSTTDSLEYFNLPETNYTLNVTYVDFFNRANTTFEREFQVDTITPGINFTANADVNNSTGNFAFKDNVYVNVSINETNTANITFTLFTSFGIVSQTTFTDGTTTINWTGLSEDMYFWNVTVLDYALNWNSTETRHYGVIQINGSAENEFNAIDVELGTNISLNGSNSFDIICVDILHPAYGVNYSCSNQNLFVWIVINSFRRNLFSDNSLSQLFSYTGFDTQFINITSHQYDLVDNLSLNISGANGPIGVTFFASNTTDFDRSYDGMLFGSKIILNDTINNEEVVNITFSNPGSSTINFYIDDNAKFTNFTLNIGGVTAGVNFTDDFDNFSFIDASLLNAQLDKSQVIMTANSSLSEFIFDDFEDDSIASHWLKTDDFDPAPGGILVGTISESDGRVKISQVFNDPGSQYTTTSSMQFVPNASHMNLYTSENITLHVTNIYDSNADNLRCKGNGRLQVGGTTVWTSFFEPDNGVGGDSTETSRANITFGLTKNNQTAWRVQMTGVETTNVYLSAGCGRVTTIYNWTSGISNTTTDNCGDTSGTLDNDFFVNVNYASSAFNAFPFISATTNCETITERMELTVVNTSRFFRQNGSVTSDVVFTSSGNIASATLDAVGANVPNEEIVFFVSSNDGDNWEPVPTLGESVSFAVPGTQLRWKALINLSTIGYHNETTIISHVEILTPSGSPENITFDFGNDGIIETIINGTLNETNGTITIAIEGFDLTGIFNQTPDIGQHTYQVPLVITTASLGQLNLDSFNISYDPNPVILNATAIQAFLDSFGVDETNFTIPMQSTNGDITVNDIRYDYAGGNSTVQVLFHDVEYTQNVSYNLTYFFSFWDWNLPQFVDFLEFIPASATSKNVTPYGQTETTPFFNLTTYNHGGKNMNLSVYLNETHSCVNLTISANSTKAAGFQLNNTWTDLSTSLEYKNNSQWWMWADYSCSTTNWQWWFPDLYFRGCAEGSYCSEDII